MAKELFDFGVDPITGLRCAGFEEDGEIVILNQAPGAHVDAHMNFNNAIAENAKSKIMGRESNGGIIARVPEITHWRWKQEWKNGPRQAGVPWNGPHNSFLAKKLREVDNKKLRFANV